MRYIFSGLFICLSSISHAWAQDSKIWKGLELGMTSAAVVEKVGKPKRERMEDAGFKVALPPSTRERQDFKKFTYEKSDGWEKVTLSFLSDRLVGIELWPKNKTLEAASLPARFGLDFLLVEAFAKGVDLGSFEGQKETSVPKVYPATYNMVAVASDRYVISFINNGSLKAIFKDGLKKPTIAMFPGYVESITLIQRSIETK